MGGHDGCLPQPPLGAPHARRRVDRRRPGPGPGRPARDRLPPRRAAHRGDQPPCRGRDDHRARAWPAARRALAAPSGRQLLPERARARGRQLTVAGDLRQLPHRRASRPGRHQGRGHGHGMTLDLAKVSPQLRQMSQRLLDRREQLDLRLEHARATFAASAPRWEELRDLAEGRESRAQRLASPREPLDTAAPLPELPPDRCVVATDGSQIEPDRHGPSEYYLINIGWAVLRYGGRAAAELASAPTLAYELDDL